MLRGIAFVTSLAVVLAQNLDDVYLWGDKPSRLANAAAVKWPAEGPKAARVHGAPAGTYATNAQLGFDYATQKVVGVATGGWVRAIEHAR